VSGARAAFVDRDGVICELVPDPATLLPESPLRVEDVALVPGAAEALNRLASAGWLLIGVSNQPAAAKGTVSKAELEAVQGRVLELLAQAGVHFDRFYICPHHPDGVVPGLSGPCDCRKPSPGMLLTAAREIEIDLARSWMIGDTDSDIAAGRAAGCRTLLVEHEQSGHKRESGSRADAVADSLGEGVAFVLNGGG
jgi:D-glycero-D-manno-heptose 1,7-bisphosphate phosphatase